MGLFWSRAPAHGDTAEGFVGMTNDPFPTRPTADFRTCTLHAARSLMEKQDAASAPVRSRSCRLKWSKADASCIRTHKRASWPGAVFQRRPAAPETGPSLTRPM
ncbi:MULTISPECIES: hypothetical protein [unclassified Variovorax]